MNRREGWEFIVFVTSCEDEDGGGGGRSKCCVRPASNEEGEGGGLSSLLQVKQLGSVEGRPSSWAI